MVIAVERLGQTWWKKCLALLQVAIAFLFILALFTINFTPYTGYSYNHCDTFDWKNVFQTASAHGLLRTSSPDDVRVADIENVSHMIAQYFGQYGAYPVLHGDDYVQNWDNLTLLLSEAGYGRLPHDPCSHQNHSYQYVYASTETGDAFVLGALLSDTDYRLVSESHNDIDGFVLGLWCGKGRFDREYCITESSPHEH